MLTGVSNSAIPFTYVAGTIYREIICVTDPFDLLHQDGFSAITDSNHAQNWTATPITIPSTVSNNLNLFDVMATMPDQKALVKFISDQALIPLLATAHLTHSSSHSVKFFQLHQGDKKSHFQRIFFWCRTNSQTVCFWHASEHNSYHADVGVTLC